MNQKSRKPNYRVLPLPKVQQDARKLLSKEQLREGIRLARMLRFYPRVPELDMERCGLGYELRVEHPVINKQGWLRAIFWVHEESKTIYVIDIFWKKTNRISTADAARIDHRIRQLRLLLKSGEKPWER
jgi:phage-related protein